MAPCSAALVASAFVFAPIARDCVPDGNSVAETVPHRFQDYENRADDACAWWSEMDAMRVRCYLVAKSGGIPVVW